MKTLLFIIFFSFFSLSSVQARILTNKKLNVVVDNTSSESDNMVTSLVIAKLCGASAGFFSEQIQKEQIKTSLTFKQAANSEYLDQVVNDEYYKVNSGYKGGKCKIRIIKVEPQLTDLSSCEWLEYGAYKSKNTNMEPICVGSIVCYKGVIDGIGVIEKGKNNYYTPVFCNTKNNKCPTAGECGSEQESISKNISVDDYLTEKYQVEVKTK
ncbi:MAG: hypothetical protein WCQ47_06675 [bacterium]